MKVIVMLMLSIIMYTNCYAKPIQVTIDPSQLPKEIVEQIKKSK